MRWAAGLALLLLAALGGAGAWVFWPVSALEARFGAEDCRRLALLDEAGAEIRGVEDIAAYGPWLFLSAEDRLAAAAAAAEGRRAPEGGLYRLPLAALSEPGPVRLARDDRGGFFGPLHPHGIDARAAKLLAINRAYGPEGAAGREIRVYAIREDGLEPLRRLPNPGLCAANDLVLFGVEARLTLDREGCPGIDLAEAAFGGATGALARIGTGDDAAARLVALSGGLAFANGIAAVEAAGDTRLAVAETRGRRVAILPAAGGEAEARHPLPGAPDNLTAAPGGGLVAALHPRLPRFALYRYGHLERAPSRLVRLDPETGAVEALFDDPAGRLFPGATVGVLTADGRLVAGSVRAAGLLICGRGAA